MTSQEKLRDLNQRIEDLQRSPDRDEAEIKRLEHDAAEIIEARAEARMRPIEEGLNRAIALAEELLQKS